MTTLDPDPPTVTGPLAYEVGIVSPVPGSSIGPLWTVVTSLTVPAGVDGDHRVIHVRHDDDLPLGGVIAIAERRAHQVVVQRYTPGWDAVHHDSGSLAMVAGQMIARYIDADRRPPGAADQRACLATAGAFIAAEIDRLDQITEEQDEI